MFDVYIAKQATKAAYYVCVVLLLGKYHTASVSHAPMDVYTYTAMCVAISITLTFLVLTFWKVLGYKCPHVLAASEES